MPFLWGTHWVSTSRLDHSSELWIHTSATDTSLWMLPSHLNWIYLRQNFYYPQPVVPITSLPNQEHHCQEFPEGPGSIPGLGTKISQTSGAGCSIGSLEEPLLLLPHRSLSESLSRLRCFDIPSPLPSLCPHGHHGRSGSVAASFLLYFSQFY